MRKMRFTCLAIIVALFILGNQCFAWDVVDKNYSKVNIKFGNSKCSLYLSLKLSLWHASVQEDKIAEGKPASGFSFNFRLLDVQKGGEDLIILVDENDQVIWHTDKNFDKQALPGRATEIFSAMKSYIRGFKAGVGLKNKNI
jgi:hypothetical protein